MQRIFEYLNITSWDKINIRWMNFDQVLRVPAINKFQSDVLSCKEIMKSYSEANWNLGKPEYVKPYDFWYYCEANGLDEYVNELADKDRIID